MNKIKVIDLLNMISKGEEVPDAIKWGCHDFEWFVYEYKAKGELGEPTLLDYLSQCPHMLNDEIIIFYKIEEKKIPEKIPYYSMEKIQKAKNKDEWLDERISLLEKRVEDLHIKMNDLLDYLKSKGE